MATNKIRKHDVDLSASDVGAVSQAPTNGLSTSILEEALKVANGVYHYILNGSDYTGEDLPNSSYAYSSCTIYRRSKSVIKVFIYGIEGLPTICNYYNGSSWSGWTTEFLPLTGGTLSGILYLQNHGYINANEEYLYLVHQYNDIVKYLAVSANYGATDAVKLIHSGVKAYNIYGEHNKPSGSYTGNGSATERIINTGGFGFALLVVGGGHSTIIFPSGGIGVSKNGSNVNKLTESEGIYFSGGTYRMATTSGFVNQNGTVYNWFVL